MKYSFVKLISLIGFCTSCNNASETTTTVENKDSIETTAPRDIATTQCYAGLMGKDSIFLQLNNNNNIVLGDLEYKRFQKDQNKGTIAGEMRGDTLLADYTFMSEGKSSVREVIFLKKGNMLVEGFGDVEEKNGKMVFKNTGTVKFNEAMSLKETDCNSK
jgi:hypothetical protein